MKDFFGFFALFMQTIIWGAITLYLSVKTLKESDPEFLAWAGITLLICVYSLPKELKEWREYLKPANEARE